MSEICQSKNKSGDALLEKSFVCGSGAGMKHIGFYLDGLEMTVNGKKDGTNCTQKVDLKLKLNDNGKLVIAANTETGNE